MTETEIRHAIEAVFFLTAATTGYSPVKFGTTRVPLMLYHYTSTPTLAALRSYRFAPWPRSESDALVVFKQHFNAARAGDGYAGIAASYARSINGKGLRGGGMNRPLVEIALSRGAKVMLIGGSEEEIVVMGASNITRVTEVK